ncbi:MAG: PilZ domain-containing protein [Candidatus Omnitrophica bacterium]|nr:PilZ domain-containing protein [Candidatus Omnitrophota bacterium]
MSSNERRRDPRVDNNVPVKISSEDFDVVTESKNLSSSGAYCLVDKPLEPMTKLKIQLLLPVKQKNKTIVKKISCCGVVVRSQPQEDKKCFSTAIYFNDIKDKDKKVITQYIDVLLKNKISTNN